MFFLVRIIGIRASDVFENSESCFFNDSTALLMSRNEILSKRKSSVLILPPRFPHFRPLRQKPETDRFKLRTAHHSSCNVCLKQPYFVVFRVIYGSGPGVVRGPPIASQTNPFATRTHKTKK